MRFYALIIFSIFALSCSKAEFNSTLLNSNEKHGENPDPLPEQDTLFEDLIAEKNYCPDLSFEGIKYNNSTKYKNLAEFALALNITGSFEGNLGWKNIANNFDNQGLSLGLLNQNLGQGTLQPMLLKLRKNHFEILENSISEEHLDSLLTMLEIWIESRKSFSTTTRQKLSYMDQDRGFELLAGDPNKTSVDWAEDALYDRRGRMNLQWKQELQKMAEAPEYVTLQVSGNLALHETTFEYMQALQLTGLRSFLMIFDVVVQNGGFYSEDIKDIKIFMKELNEFDELVVLKELLELRIRHVKSEYKEDVRKRKLAIILGEGTVHGAERRIQQEYCFDLNTEF